MSVYFTWGETKSKKIVWYTPDDVMDGYVSSVVQQTHAKDRFRMTTSSNQTTHTQAYGSRRGEMAMLGISIQYLQAHRAGVWSECTQAQGALERWVGGWTGSFSIWWGLASPFH